MPDLNRQNATLSTLSTEQQTVIAALAEGRSVVAAAEAAGIHRTSIYQWMKNDSKFLSALNQARIERESMLAEQLRDLASRAFSTIAALLDDPATPPQVRLKAALSILDRPRASSDRMSSSR